MNEKEIIAGTYETGKTKLYYLKRFWSKAKARKQNLIPPEAFSDEWKIDTAMLDALGIGIEQVFTYLFKENKSFEEFEDWVLSCNNGKLQKEKIERFHLLLDGKLIQIGSAANEPEVLQQNDLLFWKKNGYVIVPNSVPDENCAAASELIWQYLGMDKNNPDTWYQSHKDRQGIMVQLFQHPLIQANRDSRRIRKAFEQLWETDDLWVNTDRVGFNPPETEQWKFPGPDLHWDVSLELPIPFGLQGILYLTDTAAEQGAFTLVPGFHLRIDDWIRSLSEHANPRTENLHALGSIPLAGKAGDFIIWHQALPHGSRPNTTKKPRMVQYITMQPVNREIKSNWK
jgi:hypothetical protein